MRVAFVVCRDWTETGPIRREMQKLAVDCIAANAPLTVVTGDASGADWLAWTIAGELSVERVRHRADWDGYGKSAGPRRNAEIVRDAAMCVAFWDGKSRGTLDCITQFVKAEKPVRIVPRRAAR